MSQAKIVLDDAFIASYNSPILTIGGEFAEGSSISRDHFYTIGTYTPPPFRRPRLSRWAPLARRVVATRAFWRWLQR